MDHASYLSPLAVVGDAGRKGKGLFAAEPVRAGATIAAFGGDACHRTDFDRLSEHRRVHAIQIDEDLYMVARAEPDPADYANHSCEPNAGILGNVLLVAMSDIAAGQEICFDYAMCDTDDYDEFVCECGTSACRRLITGGDWKLDELQQRYDGYFSSYISRRIAALAS